MPATARALTEPPLLDAAAAELAADSIDVIGQASKSTAYAIGSEAETSMVARLLGRTGIPVAATCWRIKR